MEIAAVMVSALLCVFVFVHLARVDTHRLALTDRAHTLCVDRSPVSGGRTQPHKGTSSAARRSGTDWLRRAGTGKVIGRRFHGAGTGTDSGSDSWLRPALIDARVFADRHTSVLIAAVRALIFADRPFVSSGLTLAQADRPPRRALS